MQLLGELLEPGARQIGSSGREHGCRDGSDGQPARPSPQPPPDSLERRRGEQRRPEAEDDHEARRRPEEPGRRVRNQGER